jgi:iron complex outermembrane recepter protein
MDHYWLPMTEEIQYGGSAMKSKYLFLVIYILLFHHVTRAQEKDTIVLKDITVSSYLGDRPYLRAPSSVSVITGTQSAYLQGSSILPVLNTIPGARMEERSPGSYRLSIRGSLLRSPFGIRNIKIYIDEFPLTDAGGNSYLNLLDINIIERMEVLKGPDGSLFGANSGGVLRISLTDEHNDSLQIDASATAGSYGLFQQHISAAVPLTDKNIISLNEAMQQYDGYRKNSSLNRKYFQLADRWNYSSISKLSLFLFYSDLDYRTPGGLTLQQWEDNPRDARLPTATLPGAVQQQAGVMNKTFYTGVMHEIKINSHIRHVLAIFGSHTDFENPFITNYEVRDEENAGVRSWLEVRNKSEKEFALIFNIGGEAQRMTSTISNYGNKSGSKDTVQVIDDLTTEQGFLFARIIADYKNRFTIEASASINDNRVLFSSIAPVSTEEKRRSFTPQVMPRFAASYLLSNSIAWRASVSRGYSPPGLAEIRSSDNIINTSLEPESGWNYETGFRIRDVRNRIMWDVSAFYFSLENAIVRRVNDSGDEYFINAGGTQQPGFESQVTLNIIRQKNNGFVKMLQLSNSYTYHQFTFSDYFNRSDDYSGNELTGVPEQVIVTDAVLHFPLHFFIFAQHSYTSEIPLNDANTEYADSYQLIYLKAGWNYFYKRYIFQISVGIDNALDEKYSLGNDLNAAGGRYYNAAPGRNYFVSLSLSRK